MTLIGGTVQNNLSEELTAAERRWVLAGAALSMAGIAAALNPMAVCLTSVGRSFGDLSPAQLGLIPTVTFVGMVTGILVAGPLADRWGMRAFMIVGAGVEVAGLAAMALAPGCAALLAATWMVGIGSGFVDALASPLVSDLVPDDRASALNFLHACYPIGAVLMVIGSSALLAYTGTWRIVFPVMALPTIAALLVFVARRFPRHEGLGQPLQAAHTLVKNSFFWVGVAGLFLAGATELGVSQWTPAYVEKVFHWPPHLSAGILFGFSLGMTVGRLGMGGLTRRVAPARLIPIAAVSCLVCLLVATTTSVIPALVTLVLTGLFVAGLWPTLLAYVADRVPEGGATMFSLLAASGNAGGIVAPGVVGLVAAGAGLRWGLGTVAIYPLAIVVLFVVLCRKGKHAERGGVRAVGTRPNYSTAVP